MGGMGGMNPYGGGMGFGAGGGDPFADLMGSGMGAPGGLQGGGHNPWAPGAQTPAAAQQQALAFEQQMKVFNEQMTQMFKDIPAPGPEDQQQAQASMAETIAMLSGQAGGEGATTNPDGSTKSLSAEQAGMKKMIEAMSGAGGTDGGMQSVMDTMLQHLLSKDVLYEPMKEIAQKYPPWLKKHGKKIPDDELARYESQLVKTR
jgi:peroxin-19|tara:strand:+ start:52 stop:660 length:609 start_codon:yes stop_codon:yes gene_type:complete